MTARNFPFIFWHFPTLRKPTYRSDRHTITKHNPRNQNQQRKQLNCFQRCISCVTMLHATGSLFVNSKLIKASHVMPRNVMRWSLMRCSCSSTEREVSQGACNIHWLRNLLFALQIAISEAFCFRWNFPTLLYDNFILQYMWSFYWILMDSSYGERNDNQKSSVPLLRYKAKVKALWEPRGIFRNKRNRIKKLAECVEISVGKQQHKSQIKLRKWFH